MIYEMPKRILIVDDSNLMRHRIGDCLTQAGYDVVGRAKDGTEAVELYEAMRPDVVTMDITMRGKDGITAAREIFQLNPNARIIFYTLLDMPDVAAKIAQLPVTRIVRKGDEESLLQVLKETV
jgi:two-component system chemotaxis response regulator CheY